MVAYVVVVVQLFLATNTFDPHTNCVKCADAVRFHFADMHCSNGNADCCHYDDHVHLCRRHCHYCHDGDETNDYLTVASDSFHCCCYCNIEILLPVNETFEGFVECSQCFRLDHYVSVFRPFR